MATFGVTMRESGTMEAPVMAEGAMVAMGPDAMMRAARFRRRLKADKHDSGDQSSSNLEIHYDVFPSRFERVATLFPFVFIM